MYQHDEQPINMFRELIISTCKPHMFNNGFLWPSTFPVSTGQFFLWGFLKERVFKRVIPSVPELKHAITACPREIDGACLVARCYTCCTPASCQQFALLSYCAELLLKKLVSLLNFVDCESPL